MTTLLCVFSLIAVQAPAEARAALEPQAVVARVGSEPIHAREVARLVERVAPGKKVDPDALPALQAQSLAELSS